MKKVFLTLAEEEDISVIIENGKDFINIVEDEAEDTCWHDNIRIAPFDRVCDLKVVAYLGLKSNHRRYIDYDIINIVFEGNTMYLELKEIEY